MRRQWLALLIPLAVSASPWIIGYYIFSHSPGVELEGAYYLVALISIILFALAGPLTGVVLSTIMRSVRLGLAEFVGLFLLVTAPMIWFQARAIGVSAVPLFLPLQLHLEIINEPQFTFWVAIIATGIYGAFSLILYSLAKRGVLPVSFGAVALFLSLLGAAAVNVFNAFSLR